MLGYDQPQVVDAGGWCVELAAISCIAGPSLRVECTHPV